jgi:hypothetical protein
VQVDVRRPRAHREGRQLQPVEDQVRRVLDEQPILAAGRLAFSSVGDDHRVTAGRNGSQLAPGREGGAAVAGQASGADDVDQRGRARQRRERAGPRQVRAQVGRQRCGQAVGLRRSRGRPVDRFGEDGHRTAS